LLIAAYAAHRNDEFSNTRSDKLLHLAWSCVTCAGGHCGNSLIPEVSLKNQSLMTIVSIETRTPLDSHLP
jgi:hypothetical protein